MFARLDELKTFDWFIMFQRFELIKGILPWHKALIFDYYHSQECDITFLFSSFWKLCKKILVSASLNYIDSKIIVNPVGIKACIVSLMPSGIDKELAKPQKASLCIRYICVHSVWFFLFYPNPLLTQNCLTFLFNAE